MTHKKENNKSHITKQSTEPDPEKTQMLESPDRQGH